MKRSLSATASIEFWVTRGRPLRSTNPSIRAANSRSIGSVVPAMAPEPSGHTFALPATSDSRVRSRSSISIHARRWWDAQTGWALWRWVYPGMTTPRLASATPSSARCTPSTRTPRAAQAYLKKSLMSVATWSLRLRAVGSFAAAGTRLVRARSMFMWTSSSFSSHAKRPPLICARIASSPAWIAFRSPGVIRPTWARRGPNESAHPMWHV